MEHVNGNGCEPIGMIEQPTSGEREINQMASNENGKVVLNCGECQQLRPNIPLQEVRLFVGRLPRHFTEANVQALFALFGTVLEAVIIKDKVTSAHKGSAFVRMASMTQADAAIRALHNIKVLEENLPPIQVRYANGETEKHSMPPTCGEGGVDQVKLFVGCLPKTVTHEELAEVFSPFGTIDEVFPMKDQATGACKGCAFVKFKYKEEALFAIKSLNGNFKFNGSPRPIEVRFADSNKNALGGGGKPGLGGFGHRFNPQGQGGGYGSGPMGMGNGGGGTTCNWKEYFTNENKPYYYHELTKITQWERPAEFVHSDTPGPLGANLFLFHFPNEWTREDLIENFAPFGKIKSVRVASEKGSNRPVGYAFVSFEDRLAASNASCALNGLAACGKRLKVEHKKGEESYAVPPSITPNSNGIVPGLAVQPPIVLKSLMSQNQMGMMPGQQQMTNMQVAPQMCHFAMPQAQAVHQYGAYGYAPSNRYSPY